MFLNHFNGKYLITIIGVHPINAPEPCHLIEAHLDPPNMDYAWGEITQEEFGEPRKNWQAVYEEQPLDDVGSRWAFFFHYLDFTKPLLSPQGQIKLPEATPVPEHLSKIEYEEP